MPLYCEVAQAMAEEDEMQLTQLSNLEHLGGVRTEVKVFNTSGFSDHFKRIPLGFS